MKNEEIIIDGVDVSGCIYKKDDTADCGMLGDFSCEGQMCLYKQLKLQEQENVRLREKFNNLISTPIYENCNLLLEQKRRLEKCLQEIKEIAEETVKTTGMISAGFIIQKITEAESEG